MASSSLMPLSSKMKLYLGGKVFFNYNLAVRISSLLVITDRSKYDLIIFLVDVNIPKTILGILIWHFCLSVYRRVKPQGILVGHEKSL